VPAGADQTDAAFAHIWLRTGWLAIRSHRQLWALPIPLAGTATLLSENWDTLPSADGHTVWIQDPVGGKWVTVDGRGFVHGNGVARRPGERLEAIHGQTALVRDGDDQTLKVRRPGVADVSAGQGIAICQAGSLAFIRSDLGATLNVLDLTTGSRSEISRQGFGCWGLFASTSPDGTAIAVGCSLAPAPKPRPPHIAMGEWIRHPDNPRSTDNRNIMAMISVPSLSVTLLEGVFDNFATTAAWSSSSDGFAFAIPFEKNTCGWADRTDNEIRRVRVPPRSPTPLCDVSELLGRGID
jgi:hypothetical protein